MALKDLISDPRFQNANPEDQTAILKHFGASDEFINKYIESGVLTSADQTNADIGAGNEAMAGAGVPFEPVMMTEDAKKAALGEAQLAGAVPLAGSLAGVRTLGAAKNILWPLAKGMAGGAVGEEAGRAVGHPYLGATMGFALGSGGLSKAALARRIWDLIKGGGAAAEEAAVASKVLPPSPPAGATVSGASLSPEAAAAVENFQTPKISVGAPKAKLPSGVDEETIKGLMKIGFSREQAISTALKAEEARLAATAAEVAPKASHAQATATPIAAEETIAGPPAQSPNVKPATIFGGPPKSAEPNPALEGLSLEDILKLSIEQAKRAKLAQKAADLLKTQGEAVVTP